MWLMLRASRACRLHERERAAAMRSMQGLYIGFPIYMAQAIWGAALSAWKEALRFILDVMNDPRLRHGLRDRAAIVALPFVHRRSTRTISMPGNSST